MKKYIKNFKVTYLLILLIISIGLNIVLLSINKENSCELPENIVFFGDSITNRYKIEEFFSENNVINSGIDGDRTDKLLERIDKDVYRYNPSKVFLLIGINDMNHGTNNDKILTNIEKIIKGIQENNKKTKIYVESIYPINWHMFEENKYSFNSSVNNEEIKKMNKKIKKLCKNYNVTYIDVFKSLIDEEGRLKEVYTKEGLHLTDLGYFKVTKTLQKYIDE